MPKQNPTASNGGGAPAAGRSFRATGIATNPEYRVTKGISAKQVVPTSPFGKNLQITDNVSIVKGTSPSGRIDLRGGAAQASVNHQPRIGGHAK